MNDALGEKPAPFGAPETTVAPGWGGGFFETGRPRLGGLEQPVRFTDAQAAVLNALADTIIPPHPDWPNASEVDLVAFCGRYITPSGYKNKHFPFADADSFTAALDKLGQAFVDADPAERAKALEALEKAEDPFFEQIRALVYYGYYSRPEVVIAIRRNVPAGKDYHGPPLPYGYIQSLEPWDETTLAQANENGSYLETEQVTRVDLSKLTWTK
ncbi:gluconate 2-dehydrogenase subunit 3 family protein [Actinomycetospora termitidis]|uniref:Gluconate 2-dehydrogenase subunit 3 family protein n=1 Tax=Actinomycetospora termitidis TaxID=3053470 RepID=A0ABT7MGS8_9PSEU|nr:gluconate 2-dehydrogenase subunit 3 family protein [Actinomycetospora sp. Odt1-22]MDL5159374.1 gluconate 2-dehydrogenase subunit 3 family protein [Actinomycetospora sp. Odt1-22]